MMGWQWHQHMQVIRTSLQTDNHASTSSLKFVCVGCFSCRPTNSVKALRHSVVTKFLQIYCFDGERITKIGHNLMYLLRAKLRWSLLHTVDSGTVFVLPTVMKIRHFVSFALRDMRCYWSHAPLTYQWSNTSRQPSIVDKKMAHDDDDNDRQY